MKLAPSSKPTPNLRLMKPSTSLFFAAALLLPGLLTAAELLTPLPPIQLTGTKGKFDFIAIDAQRHRLLAAHTGNGTLEVIDLEKNTLAKSIATGAAQDCA